MQLAVGGKLLLRQINFITPLLDFFANDVGGFSFSCHVQKCELDNRRAVGFICYVIVAKRIAMKLNQNTIMTFIKRIGPDPHANGAKSAACRSCPDIWELENGDFAVIGIDITDAAVPKLPPTAGCGPDERIVRLPRNLLVNAKRHIPDRL
jgi:hypothetical protein